MFNTYKMVQYNQQRAVELLSEVEEKLSTMENHSVRFKGNTMTRSDMDTLEMMLEMVLRGIDAVNEMALATDTIELMKKQGVVVEV